MDLSLSREECLLIAEMLDSEIQDLRSMIYHGESHEVKEALRRKEEMAKRLRDRLRQLEAGSEAHV